MTRDTRKHAEYAEQEIKYICSNFEKRPPGSKGERDCQRYLGAEIEKNGWADKVELEEFQVAQRAFFKFSKFIPFIMYAGILLFLLHPIIITVAAVLSIYLFVGSIILYWKIFDPFCKKDTSINLIATRKPAGEVKRRIIFAGHADAVWEWSLAHKLGTKAMVILLALCFVGAVVSIVLGITLTAIGFDRFSLWHWIFFAVVAAFIPFHTALLFFVNHKLVVDGAIDNLSGSLVSIAVLKHLHENNITYQNTEVVAISMGAEEAGTRGSKVYVKKHLQELKDPNIETVFVSLETLRQIDHLSIVHRDLNSLLKMDPRAVKLLVKAGEQECGKPLKLAGVPLGSTDAASFAKKGIPSIGILGMTNEPTDFYHTRLDNADNQCIDTLHKTLDISLAAIEIFDKEGLGSV
jgi:hypothetical protein